MTCCYCGRLIQLQSRREKEGNGEIGRLTWLIDGREEKAMLLRKIYLAACLKGCQRDAFLTRCLNLVTKCCEACRKVMLVRHAYLHTGHERSFLHDNSKDFHLFFNAYQSQLDQICSLFSRLGKYLDHNSDCQQSSASIRDALDCGPKDAHAHGFCTCTLYIAPHVFRHFTLGFYSQRERQQHCRAVTNKKCCCCFDSSESLLTHNCSDGRRRFQDHNQRIQVLITVIQGTSLVRISLTRRSCVVSGEAQEAACLQCLYSRYITSNESCKGPVRRRIINSSDDWRWNAVRKAI